MTSRVSVFEFEQCTQKPHSKSQISWLSVYQFLITSAQITVFLLFLKDLAQTHYILHFPIVQVLCKNRFLWLLVLPDGIKEYIAVQGVTGVAQLLGSLKVYSCSIVILQSHVPQASSSQVYWIPVYINGFIQEIHEGLRSFQTIVFFVAGVKEESRLIDFFGLGNILPLSNSRKIVKQLLFSWLLKEIRIYFAELYLHLFRAIIMKLQSLQLTQSQQERQAATQFTLNFSTFLDVLFDIFVLYRQINTLKQAVTWRKNSVSNFSRPSSATLYLERSSSAFRSKSGGSISMGKSSGYGLGPGFGPGFVSNKDFTYSSMVAATEGLTFFSQNLL